MLPTRLTCANVHAPFALFSCFFRHQFWLLEHGFCTSAKKDIKACSIFLNAHAACFFSRCAQQQNQFLCCQTILHFPLQRQPAAVTVGTVGTVAAGGSNCSSSNADSS